jgi:drug/metabolite transporter (DMT)-like permease
VGIFWSFLSAFLWGTTFVCARFLLGNDYIDPMTLSFIRFSLGGLLLLGYGLLYYRKEVLAVLPALRSIYIFRLALAALLGIVGMSVLLFYGQKTTTAINSSFIMQLNPLLILILGIFVGESITWRKSAGMAISLVGIIMLLNMLGNDGFNLSLTNLSGNLMILGSAVCWAVYSVISKGIVERWGGYAATTWIMLLGAVELGLIYTFLPIKHILPQNVSVWSYILYLAVFPTAVAFFAWYEGMRLLKLSLLNIMQYLSPVFTVLLAWLWLGERLTWLQAGGIGLIAMGIALTFASGNDGQQARANPSKP